MATDGSSTPQTLPTSGKRPRSKDDSSQVGKKTKGTCVCPVCDEVIKEPTKNKKDDEAIYCEGSCEAWLHHRCAGILSPNFAEFQNDDEVFFCPHYQLKAYKAELEALKSTVHSLSAAITKLEEKLSVVQPPPLQQQQPTNEPNLPNYLISLL